MFNKKDAPQKQSLEELLQKISREITKEEQIFVLYQILNKLIKDRLTHEHIMRMADWEIEHPTGGTGKKDAAIANYANARLFCETDDRDVKIMREVIEDVKNGKFVV